jgi:hypothetical protein
MQDLTLINNTETVEEAVQASTGDLRQTAGLETLQERDYLGKLESGELAWILGTLFKNIA